MNKTLSSQSQLKSKMKTQALNSRRARTKILIQAGSLLKMVGLFEICQIQEGDDLQFDIASRDNAGLLLGILLDAVHAIPSPPDSRRIERWRESGIRFMKQRAAQRVYQKMK